MASMKDIGKRIYNLKNTREKRRYYVFLLRAMLHRGELRELCAVGKAITGKIFFADIWSKMAALYHME